MPYTNLVDTPEASVATVGLSNTVNSVVVVAPISVIEATRLPSPS
ncbi:hypothetical protein ACT3SZ_05790 [Corynebacterium sp. AOP40-9SA-29]